MKDDMIICRCENVSFKYIKDTMKKHNCSARELKLRTRAGMGYCGGRVCRPMVDELSNKQSKDGLPLKYQPPVRPLSFEDLGGTSHD